MKIEKLSVFFQDSPVGVLSLSPNNKLCVFEYDKKWLVEGFSISPLELPLKPGIFIAQEQPFNGGFGIFEDSLPDGYGRYLLHKVLQREGIQENRLTTLDRLSIIGSSGMGALRYIPETHIQKGNDTLNLDKLQEKAIEVLQEQQDKDAGWLLQNSGNSGGCRPKAIYKDQNGHWLVKFRHIYDPVDMGLQEFHYNQIARACGITVPDFKLLENKYFASRRFDLLDNGECIHIATAGALLCLSLSELTLDYENLLALTGYITQDPKDVEEMFRRMVFNYLTDNKDDHCKNFSYYVTSSKKGEWKWHLAPAYDLTYCAAGYNGEHATSVNHTGNPTIQDFVKVGVTAQITPKRCLELIKEIQEKSGDILRNPIL